MQILASVKINLLSTCTAQAVLMNPTVAQPARWSDMLVFNLAPKPISSLSGTTAQVQHCLSSTWLGCAEHAADLCIWYDIHIAALDQDTGIRRLSKMPFLRLYSTQYLVFPLSRLK